MRSRNSASSWASSRNIESNPLDWSSRDAASAPDSAPSAGIANDPIERQAMATACFDTRAILFRIIRRAPSYEAEYAGVRWIVFRLRSQFCGLSKQRRATTCQRLSIYLMPADRTVFLSRQMDSHLRH